MINLELSDYLSKLSDEDLQYLSETLSLITQEHPKSKILLWDDSRSVALEKLDRMMAGMKLMNQVREALTIKK